jgi:NitT/TauT family transport system substrate-binding protein
MMTGTVHFRHLTHYSIAGLASGERVMSRHYPIARFAWSLCVCALLAVPSSATAQETFNVRFSWKLKGEYAPFYLAQERGLFAKEGLSVRVGEGAGSEAALGAMLQGQEDVVIIPGVYALNAISKGMPVKIIALYQPKAPLSIMSHPEKPIETPKDLEGKSLVGTVGDTTTDNLKTFCAMNKVDCGKIRLVMMNVQARLPQFVSRQVDALSTYWNIDVPQIEFSTKQKFVILDVAKYGLVQPGLSVVATNDAITRNPERLRRFLRGLSAAFDATRQDAPAAARALMNVWVGGPQPAVVEAQVKLSNETFVPTPGKPTGWVPQDMISAALTLLKESGQVSEPKPLDMYFTNSLIGN